MLFVSSHEPPVVRKLIPIKEGEVDHDPWPEDYGLDFAWITPFGHAGIQRKQFPADFLASSSDERLAREVLQMGDVTFKMIILEGKASWGTDGMLQCGQYAGGIHRHRFEAMMWSIQSFRRIPFMWTGSISETIATVKSFYKWSMKEEHTQFCSQVEYPKTVVQNGVTLQVMPDGSKVKMDWREWVLMHLPGINQKLARNILKHEPEPLRWWADGEKLEDVPLIGPGRASKMRAALKP